MSLDTIPLRSNGQTIDQTWFNLLKTVLSQELAPRDASGVVGAGVGDLGDLTNYWNNVFAQFLQVVANGHKITLQAPSDLAADVVIQLGQNATDSGFVPSGVILPYGGIAAPSGYLFCDGSAVDRTTYANLFTAIGTAYGNGNGSTTFNIPDARGRFPRFTDDMGTTAGPAGLDPDSAARTAMNSGGNTGNTVGSVQADDFVAHSHLVALNDGGALGTASTPAQSNSNTTTANKTTSTAGNAETRPKNFYVNAIIKT